MIGVYRITNLTNNKTYVGQSVNIENRWESHRKKSRKGCPLLYAAFDKYGLDNFEFVILEQCLPDKLNEKEKYYIDQYNTMNLGYNLTGGGEGARGEENGNSKLTWENVHDIIDLLESNEFSCQDISEIFNIDSSVIRDINQGNSWAIPEIQYPIMSTAMPMVGKKNFLNDPNHPFRNPETFKKSKKAIQEKYGVETYFKASEFQNKTKETKKENHGDENYNNREQAEKTYFERTGFRNCQQNPEVVKKTQKTMLEKYGAGRIEIIEKGLITKVIKGINLLVVNDETNFIGITKDAAVRFNTTPQRISKAIKRKGASGHNEEVARAHWRLATEEEKEEWIRSLS